MNVRYLMEGVITTVLTLSAILSALVEKAILSRMTAEVVKV